jgi:hypothetical protein
MEETGTHAVPPTLPPFRVRMLGPQSCHVGEVEAGVHEGEYPLRSRWAGGYLIEKRKRKRHHPAHLIWGWMKESGSDKWKKQVWLAGPCHDAWVFLVCNKIHQQYSKPLKLNCICLHPRTKGMGSPGASVILDRKQQS